MDNTNPPVLPNPDPLVPTGGVGSWNPPHNVPVIDPLVNPQVRPAEVEAVQPKVGIGS